jgi:hypothetical protein
MLGSPVSLADLELHARPGPIRCMCAIAGAALFNSAPPTQGIASLLILALAIACRRRRRMASNAYPWAGRGDQAGLPVPRPPCRRSSLYDRRSAGPARRSAALDEMAARIDGEARAALAAAGLRRRHMLVRRGRCRRPRGQLHPVDLFRVRLRPGPATDRHHLAESRQQLPPDTGGLERAQARPQAVPHAQPGAGAVR